MKRLTVHQANCRKIKTKEWPKGRIFNTTTYLVSSDDEARSIVGNMKHVQKWYISNLTK